MQDINNCTFVNIVSEYTFVPVAECFGPFQLVDNGQYLTLSVKLILDFW